MNTLERNLRKLLFNIYILNFGCDYYKATVSEELQHDAKGVINSGNKETKKQVRDTYSVTPSEAKEIMYLQNFFYSLDYNNIQKLLFTPGWTEVDESAKEEFLKKNNNLSELSDEELRAAFSKYVPKSDWERFFSSKISIADIQELIEQIRIYRNKVAHFKFFYKSDYEDCNKLVNRLNRAILKAIKITEEKDFSDKHKERISKSIESVRKALSSLSKAVGEITSNIPQINITARLDNVRPAVSFVHETQNVMNSIKTGFSQIEIPKSFDYVSSIISDGIQATKRIYSIQDNIPKFPTPKLFDLSNFNLQGNEENINNSDNESDTAEQNESDDND